MTDAAWHLRFSGWPLWLVLPLGLAAAAALLRLQRDELSPLPRARRRLLQTLRCLAVLLLTVFFSEPSLTRRAGETVLPRVALLMDHSGSMAVRDPLMAATERVAEAEALGLLPPKARPHAAAAPDQVAADQAFIAGVREGSPEAQALARLDAMSRWERALVAAREIISPALKGKVRADPMTFDQTVAPFDFKQIGAPAPAHGTDLEEAFIALTRNSAQEPVAGVILLSDGRQTTGGDPTPAVKALRARGAIVDTVFVGDPGQPPDAVVADLSGPTEVFLGENAPLTVRYRINGPADLEWNLVLSEGGRELARRAVRGTGRWEYQPFLVAATNRGVQLFQARLELVAAESLAGFLPPSGGATLEYWGESPGSKLADFFPRPEGKRPPPQPKPLSQLAYENRGQNYAGRVRGFLFPPQTGVYTFWISSDDASELWLSRSENPADKVRIAFVADYVNAGVWDAVRSQESEPVTLQAGRPYYFETLHKQGSGADHLAVGWRLPDGALERPIPGERLGTFNEGVLAEARVRAARAARTRTNSWHEASLANNSAEATVAVSEDPIRALLVDASPRWESRYLAAMLERDRRVKLTRRYRSVLIEDPGLPLLPRTQAEWNAYDMICLGDLDAADLPPDQQQHAADFVARRGGFLVCVAGPRGLPRAFTLGALANLLPVRPAPGADPGSEPVRLALTPEGAEHPITQVLDDPELNKKLWPLLPPFEWIAGGVAPKPGASVLIAAQNRGRTPLVAVQRYGAGRVFWMGAEESWRWRDRVGERIHQTFWLQAMRWGLAGRLRGADPRLQAGLDRYLMDPAESAELKVRAAPDGGDIPVEPPVVQVEPADAPSQSAAAPGRPALTALTGAPGIWRAELAGLPEGRWRITVSHPDSRLQGLREVRELTVRRRAGAEELDLSGDPAALARLASAGGGNLSALDHAGDAARRMAEKLKPRTEVRQVTIRLWNNLYSMLAVMALLCLEWLLRKRSGLA